MATCVVQFAHCWISTVPSTLVLYQKHLLCQDLVVLSCLYCHLAIVEQEIYVCGTQSDIWFHNWCHLPKTFALNSSPPLTIDKWWRSNCSWWARQTGRKQAKHLKLQVNGNAKLAAQRPWALNSCSFEEPWRMVQLNPRFDESRRPCELASFRFESIPLRCKKKGRIWGTERFNHFRIEERFPPYFNWCHHWLFYINLIIHLIQKTYIESIYFIMIYFITKESWNITYNFTCLN
jgi:hypothetical protein